VASSSGFSAAAPADRIKWRPHRSDGHAGWPAPASGAHRRRHRRASCQVAGTRGLHGSGITRRLPHEPLRRREPDLEPLGALDVGAEYLFGRTEHKDGQAANASRVQVSMKYAFVRVDRYE
jgi:hypothetical protein